MNKKPLIVGLILGVIIGLAISEFIHRGEEMKQESSFALKQECQRAGDLLYKKDLAVNTGGNFLEPQYTYNAKLNTCLYFGGYISKDSLIKWVKDSFTNKEIISFMVFEDKVLGISNEEFEKTRQELFGEHLPIR